MISCAKYLESQLHHNHDPDQEGKCVGAHQKCHDIDCRNFCSPLITATPLSGLTQPGRENVTAARQHVQLERDMKGSFQALVREGFKIFIALVVALEFARNSMAAEKLWMLLKGKEGSLSCSSFAAFYARALLVTRSLSWFPADGGREQALQRHIGAVRSGCFLRGRAPCAVSASERFRRHW